MDFLRGIIKWIILALLFIVFIVLVIKFGNRTKTNNNQPKQPPVNVVEKEKEPINETPELPEENMEPENLTVDSPDTASTGLPHMIIGFIIIGCAGRYIYKHREVKGNS